MGNADISNSNGPSETMHRARVAGSLLDNSTNCVKPRTFLLIQRCLAAYNVSQFQYVKGTNIFGTVSFLNVSLFLRR